MSSYWDEVHRESLCREARESSSPERLRELSLEHAEVMAAVAKNPRTPLAVLQALAQQSELAILVSLVQNEALPEALFEVIAAHPPRSLPRILAASPRTPPALLRRLSQNGRIEILRLVAKHPRTPPDELERLSNHPAREIFAAAQKHPNNPLYVEGAPTRRWSRSDLPTRDAELGSTPRLLLEEMTRSSDSALRRMVLWAPTLTTEQRQRLARDESALVRAEVARLLASSDVLLDELAADPDPLVRANLVLNQNLTRSLREQIARTLPPPQSPEKDPLYPLEERLQSFGRKTFQQQDLERIGLLMASVGGLCLLAALLCTLPLGLIVAAACLVVLGALLALLA